MKDEFSWKSVGTIPDKYLKCLKRNRYFRGWGLTYLEYFVPTPAFSSLLQNEKCSFVSTENTSTAAAIGKRKFKKTHYLDFECLQRVYTMYPFWTHQELLDNPEVVTVQSCWLWSQLSEEVHLIPDVCFWRSSTSCKKDIFLHHIAMWVSIWQNYPQAVFVVVTELDIVGWFGLGFFSPSSAVQRRAT